ncbi:MAG: hypothetical protein H0X04_00260 [Chthoniobacterales bacterium]|nr:hypothetical protein [Chthoniobacterales bacterium]
MLCDVVLPGGKRASYDLKVWRGFRDDQRAAALLGVDPAILKRPICAYTLALLRGKQAAVMYACGFDGTFRSATEHYEKLFIADVTTPKRLYEWAQAMLGLFPVEMFPRNREIIYQDESRHE